MSKRIDRIGQQRNSWIVLSYSGQSEGKESLWLCRCTCGHEQSMTWGNVKLTKQCMTCHINRPSVFGTERVPTTYWSMVRRNAERRNMTVDISHQYVCDLLDEQKGLCAISGLSIKFAESIKKHFERETTASLDRIDSNKGYIEGNLQWVHKDINKMKNTFSTELFLTYCTAIVTHNL